MKVLTNGKGIAIFDPNQTQQRRHLLAPLRNGEPVALRLREVSMPLPKRYPYPVLLLVPSEAVGLDDGMFVSVQGLRAEYMPREAMTARTLVRMGLTARASKMLIDELKLIYEVKDDTGSE